MSGWYDSVRLRSQSRAASGRRLRRVSFQIWICFLRNVKHCTYLLPIRRSIFGEAEAAELRNYLSYSTFYCYLTRGGYPFGDRLLAKGNDRNWMEGGEIPAHSKSRQWKIDKHICVAMAWEA